MKYFLLIAGDYYYPSSSNFDWVDLFLTEKEAHIKGLEMLNRKDWYSIVNLEDWIGGKREREKKYSLNYPYINND